MLIVSNDRLIPTTVNTITLQGEDGTFYYVHRNLYDQAVVLTDLYGDDPIVLWSGLGFNPLNKPQTVQMYEQTVPTPLRVLAPFLMYIKDVDKLDNIEDLCGALSVIAMQFSMRRMPQVPKELRAAVQFSLGIREEYKVHWDYFFQDTPTYEEVMENRSPHAVSRVKPPAPHVVYEKGADGESHPVEIEFTDDPNIDLDAALDDMINAAAMAAIGGSADDDAEPAAPSGSSGSAPKPQPAAKSGFELMKGL